MASPRHSFMEHECLIARVMPMRHLTWILMSALGFGSPTTPLQGQTHTQVFQRWEHALTSARDYTNPYAELTLKVDYSGPGNRTIHGYGFWDGGKTFRIRCAFPVAGAWQWQTECSDIANAGLHDQHGSLVVSSYEGTNSLYRHVFLKLRVDTRYLSLAVM